MDRVTLLLTVLVGSLSLTCTGGPGIPPSDGPLHLEVRFPTDAPLAWGDSVAVWGSVGNGRARLTVNGWRVRVQPNGAFIDWLPVPRTSPPVLDFRAELGSRTAAKRVTLVRAPKPASGFVAPRPANGWVRLRRIGGDTLDPATREYPITARWFPGGPAALLLPVGTTLPVEVRTDSAIRVRLSEGLRAWVSANVADTLATPRLAPNLVGELSVAQAGRVLALSVPVPEPLPSVVERRGTSLRWSILGARHAREARDDFDLSGFLRALQRREGPPGRADVELSLASEPAGWRVRWVAGRLTLEVRRPRTERGLTGLVVALDPGHPPAGAAGPTGLEEAVVTLEVARAAARRLEGLGARPVIVRPGPGPMSLAARVAVAEAADADVLVSIHLDAPAEQHPPWLVDGTRALYWQSSARQLVFLLRDSVAAAMRQDRRRVVQSDLVVLHSTWFPSALVEGTSIVLPEREAWLRTADGIEAYARGIVGGLAQWAITVPELE